MVIITPGTEIAAALIAVLRTASVETRESLAFQRSFLGGGYRLRSGPNHAGISLAVAFYCDCLRRLRIRRKGCFLGVVFFRGNIVGGRKLRV
jgi:hypothetical protein